jgi:predicted kinase
LSTKTFNVGKYRRNDGGAVETGRADFFAAGNEAGMKARQNAARDALEDLLGFLDTGGDVGVFDATNSTRERRNWIQEYVKARANKYQVVFVEVICDDPEVVETNMRNKVVNSPDFAGLTMEEALQDLRLRMQKYQDVYETIDDDSTSYIKLYNMSSKVLVNRIYGMNAQL